MEYIQDNQKHFIEVNGTVFGPAFGNNGTLFSDPDLTGFSNNSELSFSLMKGRTVASPPETNYTKFK